jgi:hypothetical protein
MLHIPLDAPPGATTLTSTLCAHTAPNRSHRSWYRLGCWSSRFGERISTTGQPLTELRVRGSRIFPEALTANPGLDEFSQLLEVPEWQEAFLHYCRGYLCQEHAMFVAEMTALVRAADAMLVKEREAFRERLLAVVDKFLAVGSDFDLGIRYQDVQPVLCEVDRSVTVSRLQKGGGQGESVVACKKEGGRGHVTSCRFG